MTVNGANPSLSACCYALRVGGVDDQLDHGNTSAVHTDPMIQRPVTPNDIVMQRLHRDSERRRPREVVGTPYKGTKDWRDYCA
ncbi:Uncharacterized protein DBV15_05887 [Temnothorax longispinosus]|uniref:Uncharacterized protein n=1 Tax=Temnothorax longispinosus TaxID=300112 RepID=A0A4S2KI58_9HYME|nr:Uncharacterized protein DBV15_05887 [Temnothorax longispinosus]